MRLVFGQAPHLFLQSRQDLGSVAAAGPDLRATADKKAFLQLWNPLAVQYSLATYQQNEL